MYGIVAESSLKGDRMKKLKIIMLAFVVTLAAVTAWAQDHEVSVLEGLEATLYKSPTCGCCTGYAEFLRKHGVKVQAVDTNDLTQIKAGYGVPMETQSCHTVVMGDYVIEGHVPLGALLKLFTEKPEVAGIGLPGMPLGTPGMEGPKSEPYNVLSFGDSLEPFYTE
jgi:hypothetical protein